MLSFQPIALPRVSTTQTQQVRFNGSPQPGNLVNLEKCVDSLLATFEGMAQPQLGGHEKWTGYDYPSVGFHYQDTFYLLRSLGTKSLAESACPRISSRNCKLIVLQSNDYIKYTYYKPGFGDFEIQVPNNTPISATLQGKIDRLWQKLDTEVWNRVPWQKLGG